MPSSCRPRTQRGPHRPGLDPGLGARRPEQPRYTGRQVWNRQRTDHDLLDPKNTTFGDRDVMRRNAPDEWVISNKPAHPTLVSEADFVAAQSIRADKTAPEHTYQLAGLLRCGHGRRRMGSCWSNGRAAYRCRHGHSSATPRNPKRTPNAYVREDQILTHLPAIHLMRTGESTPPHAAGALAPLRTDGIELTYDHTGRTLTADTEQHERVAIGR